MPQPRDDARKITQQLDNSYAHYAPFAAQITNSASITQNKLPTNYSTIKHELRIITQILRSNNATYANITQT